MIELIKLVRILLELGRDIWREHRSRDHEKEMDEISSDVRGYMRDNYRVRDDDEVPDSDTDV